MKCPRCHEETPDEGLNCTQCHINLYWAKYHYNDLAGVREELGMASASAPPSFLLRAHDDAVAERERHPDAVALKVRTFRRRVGEDPA